MARDQPANSPAAGPLALVPFGEDPTHLPLNCIYTKEDDPLARIADYPARRIAELRALVCATLCHWHNRSRAEPLEGASCPPLARRQRRIL